MIEYVKVAPQGVAGAIWWTRRTNIHKSVSEELLGLVRGQGTKMLKVSFWRCHGAIW